MEQHRPGKQSPGEQSNAKHSDSRNEGEGNKTAAREYDEAQRRFIDSGKVDEKAREAERALKTQRRELERAEAIGKSHESKEDPEISRKY